jgi:hypothetical protein
MNHFTETTTTSYGENIGNSFKGILFGFLLIVGSIILLSYNENRSINQTLALEEMQSKIVTPKSPKYESEYEKKPLLLQGEVIPIKQLEDTIFGVKANGLVLQRHVEMYQWRENKTTKSEDKLGGSTETTTTYDYVKDWSSSPINSSSFKYPQEHQNPPMSYSKETYTTDANIGDFYLSKEIISHFNNSESFDGLSKMPEQIADMKNYKTYLYKGVNPSTPSIGDIKITYNQTDRGTYSIAGMSEGKAIVPYISKNERDLLFVRVGIVSANQIFQEEFDSNTTLTWILRVVGLALMFFGFMLIMGPLSTLANVIPMFGSLIEGASAIVAGVFTLLLGSVVIAIAWFASRPILSLIIIGVGVGLTMILNRFKKDKGSFSQNTETTPPSRESGITPPPRRR